LEPTTPPYFQSHYMPNTPAQRHSMLNSIGIKSIEELFNDIPEAHRNPTLKIPPPMPELDLRNELMSMSSNNHNVIDNACFLGAGVYNHFIPSIVIPLITRGEFLTSYTPYQAEASQGTLQVAYEFQTMVCNLMGMDVANDGMYEGATSVAEAALMACRITGRDGIAIINTMSPTYREVVETYTKPQGLKIHLLDPTNLVIPKETACVLAQYPNFFGYIENLSVYKKACDESGSLLIVSTDPVAMGMFRPPGDLGADIVTGEGQGLGIPMSFGNNPGYVLTLQPREQHIRREKATSNICTSQALLALASTITIAALGKQGLRQMAELCYHKAHYAASLIQKLDGYSLPIDGTFFKEMVIKCPVSPSIINERLLKDRIIGGLDISHIMADCMLLCITEMNSKTEIESLAKILAEFK